MFNSGQLLGRHMKSNILPYIVFIKIVLFTPFTLGQCFTAFDNTRFQLKSNASIIYDKVTELSWYRCVYGQVWDGKKCTGKPILVLKNSLGLLRTNKYPDDRFTAPNYSNHKDWRVPNSVELLSIINKQCQPAKSRSPLYLNNLPTISYDEDQPHGVYLLSSDGPRLNTKQGMLKKLHYLVDINTANTFGFELTPAYLRMVRGNEE